MSFMDRPVRRTDIPTNLVLSSLLLCQFSFSITQLTGLKVSYAIALVLLLVAAAMACRRSAQLTAAIVLSLAVVALVGIQYASQVTFGPGTLPAIATYILFPVLVLAIDTRNIGLRRLYWGIAFTVVPSIVGLSLQMLGVSSSLLSEELTKTSGEVIVRYNSIYGSALLLGASAYVQLVCVWLLWKDSRRAARTLLGALAVAAGACLFFSYSRRAYMTVAAAAALTLAFRPGRRSSLIPSLAISGAVLIAFFAGGGIALLPEGPVRDRIASVVNFADDEANVLRMEKWRRGIEFISESPLLGGGPGVLSAIGKSQDELGTAVEADVAEMLYLNVLCDFGIIVGGVLLVALIWFSIDRLRSSPLQCLVTVPLLVEGVAGEAIRNPFILIFFLLAFSLARENERAATGLTQGAAKGPGEERG